MQFHRFNDETSEISKLDQRDLKILSLLALDARTPLSKLAKETYVSKVAVHNRISVLESKKVIQGYTASIDLRLLGYFTYHVFMIINESDELKKQQLIDFLIAMPNTKNVIEYSDRWDVEWVLIAKDVQDFDTILSEVTNTFSDIIIEKHKFEIIYGYKSVHYPLNGENTGNLNESIMLTKHHVGSDLKLDPTDYKIINALVGNARESILKIAELSGVTPDIARYRIKKLQESNLIRQTSAIINLSALNLHWHTHCINLKTFNTKDEIKFKEYISRKSNIIRAIKVLGDWDIMLHIVAETIPEIHKIAKELEHNFSDILVNYQSLLGYKEHYFTSFPKVLCEVIQ